MKNPKRVAAGRINQLRRLASTPEQREVYRQAALANKPWLRATGPQTAAGKARAAANNQRRPCCQLEGRLLREDAAEVLEMIRMMRATRLGG